MLSGKLLCCLLAVLSFSSTNISAVDVIVSNGDTAILPCPSQFDNSSTRLSVKWKKDERSELCIYISDSNITTSPQCSPRFKLNKENMELTLTGVESSDAGLYTCEINRLIPLPVVQKSSTLRLIVLTLQMLNSNNLSCVELLCSVQGLIPQQVNFTWTTGTRHLHHHESINMSSTLVLCKPNWTEGETFTCHISYNHTHYSKDIMSSKFNSDKKTPLVIIAVISTCAVLLLLILLGVAIFKCKKRDAANGPVVSTNKIYENINCSPTTFNPTSNPQNAQPGPRTNIRNTTSSNVRRIKQREECIYDN